MDWPEPENFKDITDFQGLTSYYRKFFGYYTFISLQWNSINTPPTGQGNNRKQFWKVRMIRPTPFTWDGECYHAFDTLQKTLSKAPVFALSDPTAKYWLHMDDYKYSLGAVLLQVDGKAENISTMDFGHLKSLGLPGSCQIRSPVWTDLRIDSTDAEAFMFKWECLWELGILWDSKVTMSGEPGSTDNKPGWSWEHQLCFWEHLEPL